LVAVLGLEAAVRQDAAEVVARLKGRGIQVSIMSGDETGAVLKVACELGIKDTWARCTPKEKQEHVKEMMQSGGKTVLYCGDGINDAAALTQASVGLHMNGGAALTLSTADATLTGTSLKGIIVMIDLSRDCYHQIIFGFSWSAFYNIFAILFAAGAFVRIRLPPEYAGLGEAISVLPVILVPLRLRLKKYW
jgi:Cu2+-exporting ATPase